MIFGTVKFMYDMKKKLHKLEFTNMIISFIMEIIVSLKFFGNGLEEVNRAKNVIFDFFE